MEKINVYLYTALKVGDECYTLTRFHKLIKRKIVKVEKKIKEKTSLLGKKLLLKINISGHIVLKSPFTIDPLIIYEVTCYENRYTFEDGVVLPAMAAYTM